MKTKFIFVTGGVCSSLGKGLTAASLGLLLERQQQKVAFIKLDPYFNVDPGTMSPYQHGEVYVTDDGGETDLDLGHYHRFTNAPLSKASNITSGQVYNQVIQRERRGDYLGKTVQVIPHITDEIKARIFLAAKQIDDLDILIVEVGGTVGDIESHPFLEAIRQICYERPLSCYKVHLTYVPYLRAAGEAKTKPTQHSVQQMRGIGLFPDMLICRSEKLLTDELKEKLSLQCHVPLKAVIDEVDVEHTIYEVPLMLKAQGVDRIITDALAISYHESNFEDWKKLIQQKKAPKDKLRIAVVGKYVAHKDAYKSIYEALEHAALAQSLDLELVLFEADKVLEEDGSLKKSVMGFDGYLIPGGFGERGWQGKIKTAEYARKELIPFFGICLGMQVMVVEFARHVLHLTDANSTEMDPDTHHPVIDLMQDQKGQELVGGTMRLGRYLCHVAAGTKAFEAYKKEVISERHRHRYEVNKNYVGALQEEGLQVSGLWKEGGLCEMMEVKGHPWMLGVQFHPEFCSKPNLPHPLFYAFVEASYKHALAQKKAASCKNP